jgi:hypothetical protein
MTLPTPETHPDFPLWQLGFTPEQVYDSFFPVQFRFLCNPKRPAVAGRFGLPEDRLWRFEFEVQTGEDGMEMAEEKQIREIVYPYVTHAGSRYGYVGCCFPMRFWCWILTSLDFPKTSHIPTIASEY